MGRCYRIACEDYLDLEAFQELVQKHLGGQARLCLRLREEEYGGRYYIEGQSTRGVEVYKEGDFLVVRIPLLADYADFFLGKLFLDIFCQFLGEQVLDQEGGRLDVREYFSDETVQQLRETDSRIFLAMLKNMSGSITLACPVSDVVFGRVEAEHFVQCQPPPSSPGGSPPTSGGFSGAAARGSPNGNRPRKGFRGIDSFLELLGEAL